jgi:hypothetical protein
VAISQISPLCLCLQNYKKEMNIAFLKKCFYICTLIFKKKYLDATVVKKHTADSGEYKTNRKNKNFYIFNVGGFLKTNS